MKRVVAVVGAAIAVVGGAMVVASGAPAAVADSEVQGSLVEDFAYPGADQILSEHGLKVVSGDGHIQYVPGPDDRVCDADQIRVRGAVPGSDTTRNYCFETTGSRGFLVLEIPHTFMVRAGADDVVATAVIPPEVTGEKPTEEVVEIPANRQRPISPGVDDEVLPQAVLVELRFGDWGDGA
ncbi:peptidase S1 and S6 chymotrypsin/Hap [Cellulomonas flavigena DSM 20109]|uniref:Peptidase S1 and S6 chymotrypsin/Hap n=2 Tax=Cellulomonas flavigena TaxID=1711 RepID=D5UBR0_CELFN|nr:peptidase S1 and S6 chymotrypsin/Hap [Cellulomonas flavigena DSM 20109]